MRLVVLGLSLSSSWGNGHATTYRSLLRAFAARGHDVLFLERDVPWYAAHRDLAQPDFCRLALYDDPGALSRWQAEIETADAVIVGSYVPDGIAIGRMVQETARGTTAFYDIDTPVTLEMLEQGDCAFLTPALVAGYDLYLSFTGGPVLDRLETEFGSPRAEALYCTADPRAYFPQDVSKRWDLSYLGTYSEDRQPKLEALLLDVARACPDRRFAVAGSRYPEGIDWPGNVDRIEHLPPADHAPFYSASRFTLNLTRAAMVAAGWSPSVRLFEAAACGTAIISDSWPGIDTVFRPGSEIVLADQAGDVMRALQGNAAAIGDAARRVFLAEHTAEHRAAALEDVLSNPERRRQAALSGSRGAYPFVPTRTEAMLP